MLVAQDVAAEDAGKVGAMYVFPTKTYSDGQSIAEQQGYTSLPTQLLGEARKKVANLR